MSKKPWTVSSEIVNVHYLSDAEMVNAHYLSDAEMRTYVKDADGNFLVEVWRSDADEERALQEAVACANALAGKDPSALAALEEAVAGVADLTESHVRAAWRERLAIMRAALRAFNMGEQE